MLDWLPGKWVKAHAIYSNKDYEIEDISLSNSLQYPGCFYLRLARVNNVWITIGSDPLFLPTTYTERAQRFMAKSQSAVSAKDIISLYLPQKEKVVVNKSQIKSKRDKLPVRFEKIKSKYKLKVNFSQIQEFVYLENYQSHFADSLKDLLKKFKIPEEALFDNLSFFEDCWNYLPHKILGNKSPAEMYQHYSLKFKKD